MTMVGQCDQLDDLVTKAGGGVHLWNHWWIALLALHCRDARINDGSISPYTVDQATPVDHRLQFRTRVVVGTPENRCVANDPLKLVVELLMDETEETGVVGHEVKYLPGPLLARLPRGPRQMGARHRICSPVLFP
jgi:hypothetical protein